MDKIIQWGILGTGEIADKFAKGLGHVKNAKLIAVASRQQENAILFAKRHNIDKACSTYEELAADNAVNVIYIATPNSLHKEHSLLCLRNNKNILCEKPFSTNEQEAQAVINTARENNLFCMEAMWSRFLPIIEKAKKISQSGEIGKITMFSASFGKLNKFDPNAHVYRQEFGGGCLLDLGIYPISLALYFLGHPANCKGFLSFGKTGVDEQACIILDYYDGSQAVLMSNFKSNYSNDIKIYGTQGCITIHQPLYRACKLTINKYQYADTLMGKIVTKFRERYLKKTIKIPIRGNGYNYEADEVGRCLRAGKIESSIMPWQDTIRALRIIDMIKAQANQ